MARIARIVLPGCPHHVTQRGNRRQAVFYDDMDRRFYLRLLGRNSNLFAVQTAGYCLMTNHIHDVCVPMRPDSLVKGFGRTHNDYSRWHNLRNDTSGHLWQNRFYSCPLDEDGFWRALRYVELNPVRAGLVENAWDWPWSSALAYVTVIDKSGLLKMEKWAKRFDGKAWRDFLREGLELHAELEEIRCATRTGRPLGGEEFVIKLEQLTGKVFRGRKPGRKPGVRLR
ncbi:MAG: transposase [Acidobacteria bacterium]|nr:transposase [Acidobacteriota bacterium]